MAEHHDHDSGPFLHARWYGTPIRRREDPRLITGQGTFIDDMTLPGMLHLAFVRSPHAHARIRSIDTAAAKAMPGVVDVLTAADIEGWVPKAPTNRGRPQPPRYVLARDKARMVGESIAVVVAETRYQAIDAAEKVTADYEVLPAVTDPEAAMQPGAPVLWDDFPNNAIVVDDVVTDGDVEAAFAAADVIIKERMTHNRLAPAAIETRGFVAQYHPTDRYLTLWSTTQAPHRARWILAEMTGLPEGRVRIVVPEMGGGFGAKGMTYNEETLGVFIAMKHGRPVKWIEGRAESFVSTQHGRGQIGYIELGAKRDGTLVGLKLHLIGDLGYTCNITTAGTGGTTVRLATNVYNIPVARTSISLALTNKPPIGAYRGAGRPEAIYYVERMMDLLARELDMDPIALRRQNFIPADAFPFNTAAGSRYDSGNYQLALDTLLERVKYDELVRQREAARAEGRLVGIGLSTYVESTGGGGGPGGWEYGSVRVDRMGSVEVVAGITAHGQGHETMLSQIVADVFGVELDAVTVYAKDTAMVPQGNGTMGSRSAVMGGSAVYLAAREVERKMRRVAAALIEANEDDLVFRNGRIEPVDAPSRGVPFARVADRALNAPPAGEAPGLEAQQYYAGQGTTYPFGAYLCMVEVDRETGDVQVLKFDGVDDCGPLINPLLVAGQVHGGIAQGVGQALCEDIVYDESGQLLSGTFMDYAIPQADTMPHLAIAHTVTPSPINPLGIKGVGEAGTIGSTPAIANAVMDALRPLGIRHIDVPLTAHKVWQAMQAAAR